MTYVMFLSLVNKSHFRIQIQIAGKNNNWQKQQY